MIFISYLYPDIIVIKVGGTLYTYQSSEYWCRRFLQSYHHGGRFNTLNWFKKQSKVVKKEQLTH